MSTENKKQQIRLEKSTKFNLFKWYEETLGENDKKEYFPFENKPFVYTTVFSLKEELKNREIDYKNSSTNVLLSFLNRFQYTWDKNTSKRVKRNKRQFLYEDNLFFRLGKITSELNKRRLDLTKINTHFLLKLYKTYRFGNNYDYGIYYNDQAFISTKYPDKVLNIKEIKKELDTRKHILSPSENNKIRKIRAKYKVSKEKAIEMMKEGK